MAWLVVGLLLVLLIFLFYASSDINSGVYVKSVCRFQTNEREIALTYDDGIDAIQTPKVLDVLAKYNVKATFFVIGERVKDNPEILKRIIAEGHNIGLHAYHHSTKFCFASTANVIDDLTHLQTLIQNIIGQKITIFRPPIGVTNPNIGKAVKLMGLKVVGWSIRSLDTIKKKSREEVLIRIEKRIHNGGIILLHDDREQSEILTEQLIISLHNKGYKIIQLS